MIIAGEKQIVSNIILQIKKDFKISNCSPANYILGIKIQKENFFNIFSFLLFHSPFPQYCCFSLFSYFPCLILLS